MENIHNESYRNQDILSLAKEQTCLMEQNRVQKWTCTYNQTDFHQWYKGNSVEKRQSLFNKC